jgi:phenylpropionate dioxygenase-like ring-hydroxylating dioxygenase large terminal subunit
MNIHAAKPTPDGRNANRTDLNIADLASNERLHASLFTDPDIFEAELERIFYKTWVYIGHESEVRKTGEFRLRQIGRQPVIMVRGAGGDVNVLFNRCRHRGAVVAEAETGRTKFFRCWYHGWTYDTEGKLTQITAEEGFEKGHCAKIGGLARPAKVESYRGFIFASISPDVPELEQHLGPAATKLDYLVDASPTGELKIDAGVNKTSFRGNWKMVGMDGYHVYYVHASVLAAWAEKKDVDMDSGAAATHSHDPFQDDALSRTRDLGNGHCMLDFRLHRLKYLDEYLETLGKAPGGKEYIDRIFAEYGEARGNDVLAVAGDPHVHIYPNMQVINNQIRIINPLAADHTEVLMFPVLFEGVPEEINASRLRQHEYFYGPAGAGSPDDAEIFERVQRGLNAQGSEPWVDISRGINREERDSDGTLVGKITDEVTQRAQMREWRKLMASA